MQAPFYPAEAESKGATASQYGLVFGVFELTVFLVSPVVGRLLTRVSKQGQIPIRGVTVTCYIVIIHD